MNVSVTALVSVSVAMARDLDIFICSLTCKVRGARLAARPSDRRERLDRKVRHFRPR